MRSVIANHVRFLFQTSPGIEAMPLHKRPRFLAAVIGGMLLCKLGVMITVSPEAGLSLLPLTLAGGTIATAWRYRAWRHAPAMARASFAAAAFQAS
jgi:hypothetical protein